MRCGAVVSRSKNGAIFRIDTPEGAKLAKFTAAETFGATAALDQAQQCALRSAARQHHLHCDVFAGGFVLQ